MPLRGAIFLTPRCKPLQDKSPATFSTPGSGRRAATIERGPGSSSTTSTRFLLSTVNRPRNDDQSLELNLLGARRTRRQTCVPGSTPGAGILPGHPGHSVVRFQPFRFGLALGIRFRAEFDPDAASRRWSPSFPSPARRPRRSWTCFRRSSLVSRGDWSHPIQPAQPTAKVAEVYPSSAELPENLLHFYLHFSAPMSRGEAYRHISLVNAATGKAVDSPFLELDEELWSSDGTRFTLVFDPGRIKRGIKPREELGPVLEAGKSYLLVVDRDWPDAQGRPLPFRISQAVSSRPPRRGPRRTRDLGGSIRPDSIRGSIL